MSHYNPESMIQLKRDCPVVAIPSGKPMLIQQGEGVSITQELGGSITVNYQDNLYRIAGHHADALGKDPDHRISDILKAHTGDITATAKALLCECYDPEIPVNIHDLGLIYAINIHQSINDPKQHELSIVMTLTSPGCGMGPSLIQDIQDKCNQIPGVEHVEVELVFDPPWQQDMMSDHAKLTLGMIY